MLDPTSFIMEHGSLVTIMRETEGGVTGAVATNAPSTTIFKTDLPSAVENYYKNMTLRFTTGNLSGKRRVITAYAQATKQITVAPAFSEAPSVTDAFIIGLDEYGDTIPTWTADADQERVMIQGARRALASGLDKTIAGILEASEYVGHLLPATTITSGCILEDAAGLRYYVDKIVSSRIDDSTSMKLASLSVLEEGE